MSITPRLTHGVMSERAIAAAGANLSRLADVQEQLATSKRLNRPSDSPAETGQLLGAKRSLAELDRSTRSATDGRDWLAQSDTVLQDALDSVRRVQELALTGANTGASGESARAALAQEVDQVRQHLLDLANTQRLGRPLFGGTTGGGRAYDADGGYVGDDGQVRRSVGAGEVVRVDVAGPSAFGDGEDSVFAALGRLSDDLRSGATTIGDRITELGAAHGRLSGALTDVGARAARLERVTQLNESRRIDVGATVSALEDVDVAAASMELRVREVAYQASLAASARTLQPSLLDFLR